MSKPIFTVGLPIGIPAAEHSKITNAIATKIVDYHVLTYSALGDEIVFGVYNAADAKDIDLEHLKRFIIENQNSYINQDKTPQ